MKFSFIPGRVTIGQPLGRFLPPLQQGVATQWLTNEKIQPGNWVLDPFGSTPQLAVELAQAGYRVLVAANNPIIQFLLEIAAAPPREDELQAAIAALAAARVGEARLEPHIHSLYETTCHTCNARVPAEAFIWDEEINLPTHRIFTCPHCGEAGEFPTTEADIKKAHKAAATPLHRARALERVAPLNDPDREHVEAALLAYPPRAVNAVFTMINQLHDAAVPPESRRLLIALLLVTLDRTNGIWPYPSGRERPRQLSLPPQYFERNAFRELEAALAVWAQPDPQPIPLTRWPDPPPVSGGICLYDGRIKNLTTEMASTKIAAVITVVPRPNQSFWTLSALWAGWLWGDEAAEPFKSVLRRQRYDWRWHTTALHNVFEHLPKDTSVFAMLPEAEPGLITAALAAADLAGFNMKGAALRSEEKQAQFTWQGAKTSAPKAISIPEIGSHYLSQRGEPSDYLSLYTAILATLAQRNLLTQADQKAQETYDIKEQIENELTYRAGFTRPGGSDKSRSVGQWWLRDPENLATPISDRTEHSVREILTWKEKLSLAELDALISPHFTGLITPSTEILEMCLASYAVKNEAGIYELNPADTPTAREDDVNDIRELLLELGERLGFEMDADDHLIWLDKNGQPAHRFYVTPSANLGEIVLTKPPGMIVLPGSRARLAVYKQQENPWLSEVLENWRFLKFRLVRTLANNEQLTPENITEQFELDPLTYESPQMRMF